MRLGDLDALLEKMKRRKDYVGRSSDPVCLVEDAPTVDAVPVVRCKDCRWREFDNCPFNEFCDYEPDDDFYCADGERRVSGNAEA